MSTGSKPIARPPSAAPTLLDRSKVLAREQVLASVKARYFPEIWYMLGNWFQTAKDKSVLEVGYGIGLVSEALARSGWRVTCVDPAAAALDDLRQKFHKSGVEGAFEQGEPEHLPYASGSFPFVVCVNMLEFSRKPEAVLAEIARVLAPNGRAVIATFNRLSPWGFAQVARAVRIDDGKRTARFLGKEEFRRILTAQGFRVENIYDRAQYLPVTAKLSKLKLPFAGAFVALIAKEKPRDRTKDKEKKPRTKVKT